MSWSALPPDQRDLAQRACTERQHDALRAYYDADGRRRAAARTLGVDRKTLDGHIAAAIRNLAKHDDFDPLPWLATAMKDTRCA